MAISKIKIAMLFLFRGMGPVVDYLLDIAKFALAAIEPGNRQTVAAAYNTLCNVMSAMTALAWLVKTRWQSAYRSAVFAVSEAAESIKDLKIDDAELTKVRDALNAEVTSWRGCDVPDTDVDFSTIKKRDAA